MNATIAQERFMKKAILPKSHSFLMGIECTDTFA
jgi:hypothetical protein